MEKEEIKSEISRYQESENKQYWSLCYEFTDTGMLHLNFFLAWNDQVAFSSWSYYYLKNIQWLLQSVDAALGLNKFAKYLLICSRWNWLNGKWTHLLVSNTLPQAYWQFIEVDNWAYRSPWHNVCQWTLPTPIRSSWSLPHGSSTVNFPMHPHIYSGGHICLWTRTWL